MKSRVGLKASTPLIGARRVRHTVSVAMLALFSVPAYAGQQTAAFPPALTQERDDFGSVTSGKLADLVLLDANPLLDIQNTTTINRVLFDGKVYDRAELDALIQGVEDYVRPLN